MKEAERLTLHRNGLRLQGSALYSLTVCENVGFSTSGSRSTIREKGANQLEMVLVMPSIVISELGVVCKNGLGSPAV